MKINNKNHNEQINFMEILCDKIATMEYFKKSSAPVSSFKSTMTYAASFCVR